MFCAGSYVRQGMIRSLIPQISLHDHVNLLALRAPRDNDARWEDLLLSGTLQYSQVGGSTFVLLTAPTNWSYVSSDQVHETHSCDTRLCPSTCELCKRLCDEPHLHGLTLGTHHLCGSVLSLDQKVITTEYRDEQRNTRMLGSMLRSRNLSN